MKKIAKLEHTLRKLHEISRVNIDEYCRDEFLQDRAKRNLQLAAQACIDIGSHIIADRGFRSPEGYGDVFNVLAEQGVLPPKLVETMKQIVGFRNILVHEYLEIDNELVHQCLRGLEDFKTFVSYIAKFINKQ